MLIGGDPGIGKSTLLLQICAALSQSKNVLYITGEESINQTKLRAERLEEDSSQLNVLAETDLEVIHQTVKDERPDLLVGFHPNHLSSRNKFSARISVSSKRKYTKSDEYREANGYCDIYCWACDERRSDSRAEIARTYGRYGALL